MEYTLHLGYKKNNLLMQYMAKGAVYSEINKKQMQCERHSDF